MLYDLCEEELFVQHRRCFDNKRYAPMSKECGCFRCLRHFHVSKITNWHENDKEKTALCPYCHVDSVIIETEREHVEHDLLCQLKIRFFESSTNINWQEEANFSCLIDKFIVNYFKRPLSAPAASRLLQTLILRI